MVCTIINAQKEVDSIFQQEFHCYGCDACQGQSYLCR